MRLPAGDNILVIKVVFFYKIIEIEYMNGRDRVGHYLKADRDVEMSHGDPECIFYIAVPELLVNLPCNRPR